MIKKGLAVAVILLFIGVAFAPSINASVVEDELVEITTEICGVEGFKQSTIRLTNEKSEELELLFDEIKMRLEQAKTYGETIETYKWAIVEMDEYGLLGDMTIQQSQKLITRGLQKSSIMDKLQKIYTINRPSTDENYLCLIAGRNSETVFYSYSLTIINFLFFLSICYISIYSDSDFPFGLGLLFVLLWIMDEIHQRDNTIRHLFVGSCLGFGQGNYGWVKTFGLNGYKSWEGSLHGKIDTWFAKYFAASYFTGFKILWNKDDPRDAFFIGTALKVDIEEI